jgi:hypothetical protein
LKTTESLQIDREAILQPHNTPNVQGWMFQDCHFLLALFQQTPFKPDVFAADLRLFHVFCIGVATLRFALQLFNPLRSM